MNQMPNRISDWDLMHQIDMMHKHEIDQLGHCIAEAVNPQLVQDYMQSFQTVVQHQKALWQIMNARGYYRPLPADAQQVQMATQEINKALAQVAGPGAPPAGGPGMVTGAQPRA